MEEKYIYVEKRACIQIRTECYNSRTKTYHLETNMNPNAIKTLSFLCIVAILIQFIEHGGEPTITRHIYYGF